LLCVKINCTLWLTEQDFDPAPKPTLLFRQERTERA